MFHNTRNVSCNKWNNLPSLLFYWAFYFGLSFIKELRVCKVCDETFKVLNTELFPDTFRIIKGAHHMSSRIFRSEFSKFHEGEWNESCLFSCFFVKIIWILILNGIRNFKKIVNIRNSWTLLVISSQTLQQ
jgi:hypothetical protein